MVAFLSSMLVQELAGMKASKHALNCQLLLRRFMYITKSISRYITAHLVFDQCNTATSLKQTTRERHKSSTGRTSYKCKDSTPIRMYLKVFLSESKTKDSLTLYLPQKNTRLSHKTVAVDLSTRDGVTTNKTDKNVSHMCTSQEEADTIIMLHAMMWPVKMKMQQSTFCQRTLMF